MKRYLVLLFLIISVSAGAQTNITQGSSGRTLENLGNYQVDGTLYVPGLVGTDTILVAVVSGGRTVKVSKSGMVTVNDLTSYVRRNSPSDIAQDATHRFATDAEKATWNGKEPAISAGTTSQYYRGDKTFQTLDKTAVGLPNVDNTSDANKPVSTAQQTALNLKADQTYLNTTNSNVATNTTNIATNTSNIATNTTAIAGKEDVANKAINMTSPDNIKYPTTHILDSLFIVINTMKQNIANLNAITQNGNFSTKYIRIGDTFGIGGVTTVLPLTTLELVSDSANNVRCYAGGQSLTTGNTFTFYRGYGAANSHIAAANLSRIALLQWLYASGASTNITAAQLDVQAVTSGTGNGAKVDFISSDQAFGTQIRWRCDSFGHFELQPSNTHNVIIGADYTTNTNNNRLLVNGTLGATDGYFSGKFYLTTGVNKAWGQATLSGGTVTVNNTLVNANTSIILTQQNCTSCGTLYVSNRTVNTSFTVTSTNASDASLFTYWIIDNH